MVMAAPTAIDWLCLIVQAEQVQAVAKAQAPAAAAALKASSTAAEDAILPARGSTQYTASAAM